MENLFGVTIRYMGPDHARRYVLQRGDHKFWTGRGWNRILDTARVFRDHRTAQRACRSIQNEQHRGKPRRTFKVTVGVTLVADAGKVIPREALVKFLADAVRIEIDNTAYGDGPAGGSFVRARMRPQTLKETKPRRKHF